MSNSVAAEGCGLGWDDAGYASTGMFDGRDVVRLCSEVLHAASKR